MIDNFNFRIDGCILVPQTHTEALQLQSSRHTHEAGASNNIRHSNQFTGVHPYSNSASPPGNNPRSSLIKPDNTVPFGRSHPEDLLRTKQRHDVDMEGDEVIIIGPIDGGLAQPFEKITLAGDVRKGESSRLNADSSTFSSHREPKSSGSYDQLRGRYYKGDADGDDEEIECKECHDKFIFSAREKFFFKSKDLKNKPIRCKTCKENNTQLKSHVITGNTNAKNRSSLKGGNTVFVNSADTDPNQVTLDSRFKATKSSANNVDDVSVMNSSDTEIYNQITLDSRFRHVALVSQDNSRKISKKDVKSEHAEINSDVDEYEIVRPPTVAVDVHRTQGQLGYQLKNSKDQFNDIAAVRKSPCLVTDTSDILTSTSSNQRNRTSNQPRSLFASAIKSVHQPHADPSGSAKQKGIYVMEENSDTDMSIIAPLGLTGDHGALDVRYKRVPPAGQNSEKREHITSDISETKQIATNKYLDEDDYDIIVPVASVIGSDTSTSNVPPSPPTNNSNTRSKNGTSKQQSSRRK